MTARYTTIVLALALCSCEFGYDQHQIASIHAVGITGNARLDVAYQQIESTRDGLTTVFRQHGFTCPGESWAHSHGKRYEYGYYLTGERTYGVGYLYEAVHHPIVQCVVGIDRKKATLTFTESEWPIGSHAFPLSEQHRQHVRDTARAAADYLRRHLPSHDVQVSIDFGPAHVTNA
jgi:hypothetical protein